MKVGDTFPSWAAFEAKLNEYINLTYQPFFVHTSGKTIESVNKRSLHLPPLKSELKYFSVTILCSHSGTYITQAKEVSFIYKLCTQFNYYIFQRLKTHTKKIDCNAYIKVATIRATQMLIISDLNELHSHETTKEDFLYYHENRALRKSDPQLKSQVKDLILAQANPRSILSIITERTGSIEDIKAISNFKRNLKLKGKTFLEISYFIILKLAIFIYL